MYIGAILLLQCYSMRPTDNLVEHGGHLSTVVRLYHRVHSVFPYNWRSNDVRSTRNELELSARGENYAR
jgi:hypothetical protein